MEVLTWMTMVFSMFSCLILYQILKLKKEQMEIIRQEKRIKEKNEYPTPLNR